MMREWVWLVTRQWKLFTHTSRALLNASRNCSWQLRHTDRPGACVCVGVCVCVCVCDGAFIILAQFWALLCKDHKGNRYSSETVPISKLYYTIVCIIIVLVVCTDLHFFCFAHNDMSIFC